MAHGTDAHSSNKMNRHQAHQILAAEFSIAMPLGAGMGAESRGDAATDQRFPSSWEINDDVASIAGSALYLTGAVDQRPPQRGSRATRTTKASARADGADASRGSKRAQALKVRAPRSSGGRCGSHLLSAGDPSP